MDLQEETQKALETFLVTFVRMFEHWTPEEPESVETLGQGKETEGSVVCESEAKSFPNGGIIEGCTRGHPTRVIVGLIQELKGLTRLFTNCKYPLCHE